MNRSALNQNLMKYKDVLFQGKHPSRWCPWIHGASATGLARFIACKEQMRLHFVEGWREKDPFARNIGKNFGTCCHVMLEKAYQRSKLPDRSHIVRWLNDYEIDLLKHRYITERSRENIQLICGLAEATLPSYFEKWSRLIEWQALETTFKVTFKFPDGRTMPIIGKRDRWYKKNGEVWIHDTKCLSRINEKDIIDTLGHDLQQMLYLWSFWKEFDKCPTGCVLDIIRRSAMQRKKDEDLDSYLSRIRADIEKPTRWDHYFKRIPHTLSGVKRLKEWESETLLPMMVQLRQWWDGSAPHFMSPDALITKYGRCDLYDPIVFGDFSRFRRVTR